MNVFPFAYAHVHIILYELIEDASLSSASYKHENIGPLIIKTPIISCKGMFVVV